jgi:hypothetical protein
MWSLYRDRAVFGKLLAIDFVGNFACPFPAFHFKEISSPY